jgi:hypothetical protein
VFDGDFETVLGRKENRDVPVDDTHNKVQIESMLVEQHKVPSTGGGPLTNEWCLVVRLRYTKGHPVWADVEGLNIPGRKHLFYTDLGQYGKYTGIFWPVTPGEARKVKALKVMTVDELMGSNSTRKLELNMNPPNRSPRPDSVLQLLGLNK